jgi:hypothetical protein
MANPLDRAGAYAKNAAKELRDYTKAWSKANNASLPPAKGMALEKKAQKELGQTLGAVLQGRRYDAQGNQIKATRQVKRVGKKLS